MDNGFSYTGALKATINNTVKVFKSTNNELPKQSTPKSAAKDLRADLNLFNPKLAFDARTRWCKQDVTTGIHKGYAKSEQDDEHTVRCIIIDPQGRALIPSGLKIALPEGYHMDVRPRSGLALKYGISLANTPGLVDEDYRGDVGMIAINTGNDPVIIVDGERLAQVTIAPDYPFEWKEVASEDDLGSTVRGEGGFNSTGTK
jgi:dUTP pyrophosphatase